MVHSCVQFTELTISCQDARQSVRSTEVHHPDRADHSPTRPADLTRGPSHPRHEVGGRHADRYGSDPRPPAASRSSVGAVTSRSTQRRLPAGNDASDIIILFCF